jgi:N-acetyldiaminopimelate deacetylase
VEKLENVCHESEIDFYPSNAEMTGEDFGYFSHLYPSLLFWLGTSEKEKTDLHSLYFLPSEKCIEIGLSILKKFI